MTAPLLGLNAPMPAARGAMPVRIIIVDDHPLFRAALRQTLTGYEAPVALEEAADIEGLMQALAADRECDLVLLDLKIPDAQGFSGLTALRSRYPDIPVVMISAVEDPGVVRRALELGAAGYVSKSVSAAEIHRAVKTVLAGEIYVPAGIDLSLEDAESALLQRLASLTPQQLKVMMMLSDGLMNKQIAYELTISEATVKAHVSAILQKLDVDSRTQAVIAAGRVDKSQFEALLSKARTPV